MTLLDLADYASPIGPITVAARDGRVVALEFSERWAARQARLERRFGALRWRRVDDPAGVLGHLAAYFAGDVDALAPVAVDAGGTTFQQHVWRALRDIPAGETRAYQGLARAIGAPAAVRAVGAANGANPIALVVPCHRVIGADGRLVGYAAGVARKHWLLAHEAAALTARRALA